MRGQYPYSTKMQKEIIITTARIVKQKLLARNFDYPVLIETEI